MLERKPLFPHVIELNCQAGRLIGCNVYLVYDADAWVAVDIGYEDDVEEVIDLIRRLEFRLSHCRGLLATHADVDHSQGLAEARRRLRAPVMAHPRAAEALQAGDPLYTFAEIAAQHVHYPMPPVPVERTLEEGDRVEVGAVQLEVWSTPGHTDSHLSFRLGPLLLSGDLIYRDGCVGAIDAHHGSDLPNFIRSLERVRDSDVAWLLPSHGPPFRKDPALLDQAITRLRRYQHMADFGVCAVDWPLLDQWEREIREGRFPQADGAEEGRRP